MKRVEKLNEYWTDIYYHLHYIHEEKLTHQAVRILQHIDKSGPIGIREISEFLNVSHNTASEHVKRLIEKKYVDKKRDPADERKVILYLTETGKDVMLRNTALDVSKLNSIYEQLSEEERSLIEKAFELLSDRAKSCI